MSIQSLYVCFFFPVFSLAALKEPFGSFAFSPTSLTSSNNVSEFTFDIPMSDPGDPSQSDFGDNFAHNVGTIKAQVENAHPQRSQIALYESNSRTLSRGRKKIQRFHSAFEKVDNMRYYLSERTLRNYVFEDYIGFSNANYCLDDVFVEENSNPSDKSSKSTSVNCSLPTVHTDNGMASMPCVALLCRVVPS